MKDIFFSTALYYLHFLLVLDVCVILLKFKIVHNFTNMYPGVYPGDVVLISKAFWWVKGGEGVAYSSEGPVRKEFVKIIL